MVRKLVSLATILVENEDARLAAVSTIPIFKDVSLCWASLVLASCTKCEQFGHTATNCLMGGSSGVCEKRVKKSAPIARPVLFGGKTWAQVASGTSSHVFLSGSTGSGLCSGLVSPSVVSDHFVVSRLSDHLAVLKCSLELLADCVSGILIRLDFFGVVPLVFSSLAPPSVVSAALSSEVDSDMIVNNALSSSDITPPVTIDAVVDLSTSSSKVLTAKVGSLKMKLVALEASVGSVLDKLNLLCSGLGLDMNNYAKQADIVHWHKDMNNMVSIVTKTKLKGKICPWITDKFDGVCVFTSGLDSGHMGSDVAIILDSSLVGHVCKVSEVPGRLLLVRLLFKNKFSVSILGLYADASSAVHFSQAGKVNSLISKVVNKSFFVILGGDFNKDGFHKYASFKKCFDLGLINSLRGSSFMKSPTWCNSYGITKTIDYVFISSNLVGVVVDYGVNDVEDYFDTDHKAVSVSVGLGGLLNVKLNSLCKQANKDHWKYDIKNANKVEWSEFRDAMAANAVMFSDEFVAVKRFSDLDAIFDYVFNKVSFWFHKLKLLVSKLVKASRLVSDSVGTLPVRSLFLSGFSFNVIRFGLAKARKYYHSFKLLESKHAEEFHMRQAIERRMESFEVDKSYTIRSVLECPFHKVVLDYLVDDRELVLKPELVKFKVDRIMEGWTRKCVVTFDISDDWVRQFQPLDYIFDGVFSNVMYSIGFDEMFGVISNLPDGKAAGLSGVTNKLWKRCDKSVLDMLLVLLNFCLDCELEGILTNTHLIALIKTACKIFSKIFSDRISLACNTFDVLHGHNFSVLKGTQSPIFTIGLMIEDDMRKAYDSVSWEHLKRSLIRIKMCVKFIRFFGSIYNGRTNRVITNFGLTDGYHVHNGLDQGEVFLSLLWHIFYDLLLCEVKRQKNICGYRLISHFVSKTGWVESQAGLTSFLATGAFVDDTIWVGSSQAAIQHILNVASNFFHLNDILINNNKTVVILINCQVIAPYLTISNLPISITRRGEPHHYLEIFLSSEGLLKPNLVKAHSDIQFFINLILRKVVSDKQFAYLVSLILFLIISYRTQFNTLIHKGLKSKSGLPLDFPNDAFHYPFLYNLKTFKQIQAKNKSASAIAFVNSFGVLGRLFSHRFHDLQVLSWHSHYPLLFPACVKVSPSNNFLAGVIRIFSGCDLSLGGSLDSAFHLQSGTPMSLVLSEVTFKHWKRLNPHGLVPSWFDLSVCFLSGVASFSSSSSSGCISHEGSLGFGVICNDLLNVGATRLFVYTDGFLSNLGTVNMLAGAVVFFEDINSGLGVRVSGLVSSTLAELQAIALALECVPSFYVAALDACRLEALLVEPDYRNCCWIEHCHIANVIHQKNLSVNWVKVKGYSGVSGNKRADALARDAALSAWHLSYLVNERFIKTGVDAVSGNSRYFVYDVFRSIHRACWEVGSSFQIVPAGLHADIDWLRSFLVWHLNSHLALGFISMYFIKALHHWLPVAVWKRLYNRSYPNVVCLFCGDVEILDHIFSCLFEAAGCAQLLDNHALAWKVRSGLVWSSSCVLQLLSTCVADAVVGTALCKGFIFSGWFRELVSVFKDSKIATSVIVDFMHTFCFSFQDDIWLVRVKHQTFMEKNGLIPHDGSVPVLVFGSTLLLLGIAEAFGVGFGFCKSCLFFLSIDDVVSIHIGA
ncbi:hypothetical protein G9A89_001982 [Geosiphon pyriformis]|nr:hypothetical protein G9A89_001982 [Geosiphon pyriformis]